jgi:ABC-type oligopeptide transport system ATPase subunit
MEPDLIIADEPVSALDVSIGAQVINLLFDLKERLGLSIIFIAHDLSVVRHVTDRFAVMYRGRLVELARTEELFDSPEHPYTVSLLSAMPLADPKRERERSKNRPPRYLGEPRGTLVERAPGHFVLSEV